MFRNKIIKMIGLNIGIAVLNTVLFSPGMAGLRIGGSSAFGTAFGLTVILMSVIVFIYGNYKLLTAKVKPIETTEINTLDDYVDALKHHRSKETFKDTIDILIGQLERLQKKKETIFDILSQKFSKVEISYQRFYSVVMEVEYIFLLNVKSIINRLNAFDEDDYNIVKNPAKAVEFSQKFIQDKLQVYNEYISYIKNATEDNEQIILKLDRLLLEISRINDIDAGDIENMPEIREINELINQTKLINKKERW